jgi:hypothetical protein
VIYVFLKQFIDHLNHEKIPTHIKSEADFEHHFVIPIALKLLEYHSEISLYIHPLDNKVTCTPDCESALKGNGNRVTGCPKCWKESEKWASIYAFGIKNTFDLVGRDSSGKTFAVEIKLVKARSGRMPKGVIQRFIGQCFLATLKHQSVIGICGYLGDLNLMQEQHIIDTEHWLNKLGISIMFRRIM